jgi:hypothetical protein
MIGLRVESVRELRFFAAQLIRSAKTIQVEVAGSPWISSFRAVFTSLSITLKLLAYQEKLVGVKQRPRIRVQMRGGGWGVYGVSANEYSCAHGAQINFRDLWCEVDRWCEVFPRYL